MHRSHEVQEINECAQHGPGWCETCNGPLECRNCYAIKDALVKPCSIVYSNVPVRLTQRSRECILRTWQQHG